MRPEGISEESMWWWNCNECGHEFENDEHRAGEGCPECGEKKLAPVLAMGLRFKGDFDKHRHPIFE
jgi:predicted  nucleic acid-binding Zn-ribbon protein